MIKYLKHLDLTDYTLIIPSVSVGNVAQLAVEILLTTLNWAKLGYVWHRNILPVSLKTDSTNGIATACELYVSEELKVVVMQIRSTYGPFASISDMFKDLCSSVKCVVILTGSYAYERKDIHLVEQPLRYVASSNLSITGLLNLPPSWKTMDNVTAGTKLRVPGSGIADHLFRQCVHESIPVLLLVEFVSEGDNRIDAEVLANYVDELLQLRERSKLDKQTWRTPAVWDLLFGNTYPMEIF